MNHLKRGTQTALEPPTTESTTTMVSQVEEIATAGGPLTETMVKLGRCFSQDMSDIFLHAHAYGVVVNATRILFTANNKPEREKESGICDHARSTCGVPSGADAARPDERQK
ncbi:hypothetical protein EVAR_99109_1 [Eumeta japonica]|uniref:Uncharacterized protein n=1 Tax=Eumeta variegata TaxID=151549 RepID=A0A4C1Z243_EUMVA|nr:hypothetical protein EVAR_99109_1 [Eumeta japonica]